MPADPTNPPQFPPRPTALAQQLVAPWLRPGSRVIDATAGNGHDTVFLAHGVGAGGQVLAFDVQEAALASTRARARAEGVEARISLIADSHVRLEEHAGAQSIAVVMFNLGYLPGEDHGLTTTADQTAAALDAAARVLEPGGILSVVCYPGHEAGSGEAQVVEAWLHARASGGWRVARYGAVGTRRPAPCLWLARVPEPKWIRA